MKSFLSACFAFVLILAFAGASIAQDGQPPLMPTISDRLAALEKSTATKADLAALEARLTKQIAAIAAPAVAPAVPAKPAAGGYCQCSINCQCGAAGCTCSSMAMRADPFSSSQAAGGTWQCGPNGCVFVPSTASAYAPAPEARYFPGWMCMGKDATGSVWYQQVTSPSVATYSTSWDSSGTGASGCASCGSAGRGRRGR